MGNNPKTDLLNSQKIYIQNILVPTGASKWFIVDLPLSVELLSKLNFIKIYRLGDLNLTPYREILKKIKDDEANARKAGKDNGLDYAGERDPTAKNKTTKRGRKNGR